jgi:hypothetical protein
MQMLFRDVLAPMSCSVHLLVGQVQLFATIRSSLPLQTSSSFSPPPLNSQVMAMFRDINAQLCTARRSFLNVFLAEARTAACDAGIDLARRVVQLNAVAAATRRVLSCQRTVRFSLL